MRNILFSRWLLSFIGTAILAALVWVFGPFIPALETWLPRAAIIGALFAGVGGGERGHRLARPSPRQGADRGCRRSRSRRGCIGRGGCRAGRKPQPCDVTAETRAWRSGLSVSTAVVRHHRAARSR